MSDYILIGDVGGTNCRFALVTRGHTEPQRERHYVNGDFPTFRHAIERYFADVGDRAVGGVVAIAGPIGGDTVGPTNYAAWRFNPLTLASELRMTHVEVINDFEAVAHALPFLPAQSTRMIGPLSLSRAGGSLAVLGPGTGLGVGALVRGTHGWVAVPSEGGHAEIGAPAGDWVKAHRLIRQQVGRVSGEHVLSGAGLSRIDSALSTLAERPRKLSAAAIADAAIRGDDAIAVESVKLFFDYLARFTGDVALMFAAKGGVFLYGGVVQHLAGLIDEGQFRNRFESKTPLERFLARVPTCLITHPTPGLIGCAAVAAEW